MRKNYYLHGFHSVSPSPWPMLTGVSVFNLAVSFIIWVKLGSPYLMCINLTTIAFIFGLWMRDIVREATYQGAHTLRTVYMHKMGFYLFVLSEFMFFLSFFWAFAHSALSPAIEIGCKWPPEGIEAIRPWNLPALNTITLIWSGLFASTSHHFVKGGKKNWAMKALAFSIWLGVFFTIIQYIEFKNCPYTIADSVFGSCFFILTGFHGIHVLVGTIFLIVTYYRLKLGHFTINRHLGLECAILYWHFVDGIWIAVFFIVYVWSYYEFPKDSWWPRPVLNSTWYNKIDGGFYHKKKNTL